MDFGDVAPALVWRRIVGGSRQSGLCRRLLDRGHFHAGRRPYALCAGAGAYARQRAYFLGAFPCGVPRGRAGCADFVCGPRSVEVVADGPAHVDFDRGVVGGTPENDALCKWNNLLRGYQVQMDSASAHILRLLSRLEKGEDDQRAVRESLGQWQQIYQRQQQLWREALYTCLRDNIHYYFPAVFLQRYPDAVDRTALLRLSQQDPLYLQGEAMQGMRRDLEAWRLRQPGQLLPDLTLPDLVSGTPRALSSFAGPGRCVLVCFWAGWCGDCTGFMTRVRRLYRTYHRRGLEVVGVSLDTDADVWRRAVRSLRLLAAAVRHAGLAGAVPVARYGLNRIPDNLLLGPDGRIVANDIPADSWSGW